jgi:hypothetical protein
MKFFVATKMLEMQEYPTTLPQVEPQMSDPDLHVFTLKNLALKKLIFFFFSGSKFFFI